MSGSPFDPTKHKATRVGIVSSVEPITIIKLEDGSIIHIKNIVLAVHAIYDMDGKRLCNDDGSPMYGIHSQTVQFIDTFEMTPAGVKLS